MFVGVKTLESSHNPLSLSPLAVDEAITNAGDTTHSPLGLQTGHVESGFDSRFSGDFTMNSGSPVKAQAPSGFRRPIKEAMADLEVSQKRLDILNQHPLYSNRRFGTETLSQDELNQLL